MAALGALVAGVAHELNTPIGNALTVASTIQGELVELRVELESGSMRRSSLHQFIARADEGLALSLKNLQRAAHLISDFKQVAVDQTSDQRRVFDLAEVSTEILNMLQPMLRKSGCNIRLAREGSACLNLVLRQSCQFLIL